MEAPKKSKKNKNKQRQLKEKEQTKQSKGIDEEVQEKQQLPDTNLAEEVHGKSSDDDDDDEQELAIDLSKLKKDQPKDQMEEENEDDFEDEEENKDKMDQEDFDMVNVDFNFYDPSEKQFHSIKSMLNGLLDGQSYNSSGLADTISKQAQVGTMVGIDEGEEDEEEKKKGDQNILGFVTMLSLRTYAAEKWHQEIMEFVLEKSKKFNASHDQFQAILTNPKLHVGLFVNERILNLSPYIVPTLHDQLRQDIEWLMKEHPDEAVNYKFDYLLVLTKVYKQLAQKQQKKQKHQQGYTSLKDYIYAKYEDFCFLEKSEMHFVFEAKTIRTESGITNLDQETSDQTCYRAIYLIKLNDYLKQVPQIQQYLIPLEQLQQQASNKKR